ncbi:hypothetical protein EUGRSUZ_K03310 [Eucalyptus grandis]|uniref:Uncharacterized protein n=2 Tax=Eucalyptus grandis TaxID=71139 RepID=A0ACC3IZC1_EUCGR|nr:hypothetical protein EUGRSUZ_K03310 [Eucalyptus grandis]
MGRPRAARESALDNQDRRRSLQIASVAPACDGGVTGGDRSFRGDREKGLHGDGEVQRRKRWEFLKSHLKP